MMIIHERSWSHPWGSPKSTGYWRGWCQPQGGLSQPLWPSLSLSDPLWASLSLSEAWDSLFEAWDSLWGAWDRIGSAWVYSGRGLRLAQSCLAQPLGGRGVMEIHTYSGAAHWGMGSGGWAISLPLPSSITMLLRVKDLRKRLKSFEVNLDSVSTTKLAKRCVNQQENCCRVTIFQQSKFWSETTIIRTFSSKDKWIHIPYDLRPDWCQVWWNELDNWSKKFFF